MPSTYTARNRLEKQAPGENNNSWGALLNTNTIDMMDQAADGQASYALSGLKALTNVNGASDEARCRYQNITGGTGGTITIPNVEKLYVVRNNSTGTATFTTGTGTTCGVPAGTQAIVVCEGGNVCRSFVIQTWDVDLDAVASSGIASAWSPYTVTPAPQSGSFTSVSATGRYKQIGKTIFVSIVVTITTNGTGAGYVLVNLPFISSSAQEQSISGSDISSGLALNTRILGGTTSCTVSKYDGTYPGGNGKILILNGVYEAA